MIDADADPGRRAWVDCPSCNHGWQYLLHNTGRSLWIQCPRCHTRRWHDTRFGVGDTPPLGEYVVDYPSPNNEEEP